MAVINGAARFAASALAKHDTNLIGIFGAIISIPIGTSLPDSLGAAGKGVAVRASDQAGGQQTGQAMQDFFNVENLLAVVKGDQVQPHGPDKHGNQPKMIEGLEWFLINGIPTSRLEHLADCGHPTTGRNWWFLNG